MDAKEFERICSVRVMVTRLQVDSFIHHQEEEEDIKTKNAVLGLDETLNEISSYGGESVISTDSQCVFLLRIILICVPVNIVAIVILLMMKEYFYLNPYCSENSGSDRIGNDVVEVKKKKRVARIESDVSLEDFEDQLKKPSKKKKRVQRIESDESETSDYD